MCAFASTAQTYEFDNLPKLKKTEKHDIDVVIDRVKVRHAEHDTSAGRSDFDSLSSAWPRASRPRLADGRGRAASK